VARRRDLLAVQTIVITFVAALRAIARTPDRDRRVIMAEQARDRALTLLDAAERNIPYVVGSPLDRAIREARRRIEETSVDE
jgi:hypothetical protein